LRVPIVLPSQGIAEMSGRLNGSSCQRLDSRCQPLQHIAE
jgi:hypothetical protein